MSVDLESRLRGYGAVLDAAIERDLTRDVELCGILDDQLVGISSASPAPRRAALVAVAVAGLLIGGSLALLTDHHSESRVPAVESSGDSSPSTTLSSPTIAAVPADGADTWDPIRVAPGTVGWYEFGDVPASLARRVTDLQTWTTDYTARFYRCATYTVDADGPICTGLIGGNFVAPATFAGTGELGTHLGDISTADLAWAKAQGSLWGYDEVTSAPPATPVAVGDHAGLMYSNSDTSYLVWEQAPGVHLWIRATGFTTDDMVALALTVRPVTLPDHLPLAVIVDSASTSGAPSFDDLLVGSHHGISRCVQINTWDGCASLPPVSDVGLVVGTDGVGGPLTAVAAVSTIGSTDRLRVDLAGVAPVTVEPVVSPLGFQYSIFRPGAARIVAAQMVAPDDSIVATATLSTVSPTPTTTVIVSSNVIAFGAIHPEVGSYVIAAGDYPTTIAAKFRVKFTDLLTINGWTIVGNQVPELPPVGTTIKIPPGWTEPVAATDQTSTGPGTSTTRITGEP